MQKTTRGFTLIELLIVVAIIAIVASIAIPNLLRARLASNESSAIGALRVLSNAQENFKYNSGFNSYANVIDLSTAVPPYIDNSLAAGNCSGYTISIVTNAIESWVAIAVPNRFGSSGVRTFLVDETGLILFTTDGSLPAPGALSING